MTKTSICPPHPPFEHIAPLAYALCLHAWSVLVYLLLNNGIHTRLKTWAWGINEQNNCNKRFGAIVNFAFWRVPGNCNKSLYNCKCKFSFWWSQGCNKVWKSGGSRSTVVGIICPPDWDRVNCPAKNWAPPPGPPVATALSIHCLNVYQNTCMQYLVVSFGLLSF